MEQIPYLQLRETIRNGDCILWQGTGFVPWAIMKWTDYSHASLVVRFQEAKGFEERVHIVESLSGGLKFNCLSYRLEKDKGRAFLFQPNCLWQNSQERIRVAAINDKVRGIKYDYKGLFTNLLGRVNNDAGRYFCSEFVWVKWGENGVLGNGNLTELGEKMLKKNKAPRPGDIPLWMNGKLTEIIA